MPHEELIKELFQELENRIPEYEKSAEDWRISKGNVAICIVTEDGQVFGKLYGTHKLSQRKYFDIAWRKASQVWITGHNTCDYEKIVFGGEMDPDDSPIELPDLIGWMGGQLVSIDDQTKLAIGFSGFQGYNDIDIVKQALAKILSSGNK